MGTGACHYSGLLKEAAPLEDGGWMRRQGHSLDGHLIKRRKEEQEGTAGMREYTGSVRRPLVYLGSHSGVCQSPVTPPHPTVVKLIKLIMRSHIKVNL